MTPAELAELKRLRQECVQNDGLLRQRAESKLIYALFDNADSLLAAAEECERLREALTSIANRSVPAEGLPWGIDWPYEVARAALEGKT